MSNLERKLDELLAPALGVEIDEVTEAVGRYHDEHPYPIERYETESINGGYPALQVPLPKKKDLDEMRDLANAFLDQYSEPAVA